MHQLFITLMKNLFPFVVFVLITSCITIKTTKNEDNFNKPVISTNETDLDEIAVDTIEYLKDTTYRFSNYTVTVHAIDSVHIPPLYVDANYRQEIFRSHNNFYDSAQDLERYLEKTQSMYFNRKGDVLQLSLTDGKTKELKDVLNDTDDVIAYTYQNFFPSINTYLIRGQLYEGDCYLLINRINGKKKYVIGEIYPAPNNQRVIAINMDLDAGYSSNGLQMIELMQGSYINKFTIEGVNWAPIALKWVDNTNVIIKTAERKNSNDYDYIARFYKLSFR